MSPDQESAAIVEYDVEFTDLLLFGGKVCCRCRHERPACRTYFARDPRESDGLKATCKRCVSDRARERYANNTEYRERKNAQQRAKHAAKVLAAAAVMS